MKLNFNYIEEKTTDILKRNNLFKPKFSIKELSKKLKLKLISDDLNDDVSGFFVMTDDEAIITYNKNHSDKRSRFTIAHEMGHFILHSRDQPFFIDKTDRVMFRNSASSTGEIFKEKEANAFAAALLMPKELVHSEINKAPNDVEEAIPYLAKTFGVSEQAMAFRLSNLGYSI